MRNYVRAACVPPSRTLGEHQTVTPNSESRSERQLIKRHTVYTPGILMYESDLKNYGIHMVSYISKA
jgi:hypothetical protein